ncbi:inositol monophosphatase family protein [Elusimicrobiota bacterium]
MFSSNRDAGKLISRYFGKITHLEARAKKERLSLVSDADEFAQDLIVNRIKKHFPKDHILAEERDLAKVSSSMKEGFLWIIDPLDGTINFLHGFPLFSVSVAVVFNGDVVLGSIFDPVRDEFFWAQKGKGAYLNKKKISVTKTKNIEDALMITGFAYDRATRAAFYLSFYEKFVRVAHDVRRTGSACIDLAWVASGRVEGFWEWNLNPWDVASGVVLVNEAGGDMTHFNGKPYSVFNTEETLATNGKVHKGCLKIISSIRAKHARSAK